MGENWMVGRSRSTKHKSARVAVVVVGMAAAAAGTAEAVADAYDHHIAFRVLVTGGLKVKYARSSSFYEQLCLRVDAYFQSTGLSPRDQPRIYLKTAILFAWLALSYLLLVFFAKTVWTAVPLAISLALAGAGIGFNVQHDGGH